jgi:hypothetical protein
MKVSIYGTAFKDDDSFVASEGKNGSEMLLLNIIV